MPKSARRHAQSGCGLGIAVMVNRLLFVLCHNHQNVADLTFHRHLFYADHPAFIFQVVGQSRDDALTVVQAGGHHPGSQSAVETNSSPDNTSCRQTIRPKVTSCDRRHMTNCRFRNVCNETGDLPSEPAPCCVKPSSRSPSYC